MAINFGFSVPQLDRVTYFKLKEFRERFRTDDRDIVSLGIWSLGLIDHWINGDQLPPELVKEWKTLAKPFLIQRPEDNS